MTATKKSSSMHTRKNSSDYWQAFSEVLLTRKVWDGIFKVLKEKKKLSTVHALSGKAVLQKWKYKIFPGEKNSLGSLTPLNLTYKKH
jgi:hypothetical protein